MRTGIYIAAVAALCSNIVSISSAANATEARAAKCVRSWSSRWRILVCITVLILLLTLLAVYGARVQLLKPNIFGNEARESIPGLHRFVLLCPRPVITDLYHCSKIRAGRLENSRIALE